MKTTNELDSSPKAMRAAIDARFQKLRNSNSELVTILELALTRNGVDGDKHLKAIIKSALERVER